jgi:ABC-type lipoprotein export system ATPase subunit
VISADDVFVLYRGRRRDVAALRGATLHLTSGERVVVQGPSGSGKTTLVRVLCGLQRPSAGRVSVDGADIASLADRHLAELRRRRLGMVDQRASHSLRPELDAVANIALQSRLLGVGGGVAARQATALLDRVALGRLAHRPLTSLSGGELQRVAVCAALAHQPRVIIADEPTGELDSANADVVYDLLAAIATATDAALLIVSHDPRAVRIADRLLRIRDGRVSEERRPATSSAETLVVDARGWVRLPDALRQQAGIGDRVRAGGSDRRVTLEPATARAAAASAPAEPDVATPGELVGEANAVTRSHGALTALAPTSLRLRRGTLVVVTGRSGSGKSTLLRILAGLERPSSGWVRIGDIDLESLGRAQLARLRASMIALVTQSVAVTENLSLAEAVTLAASIRGCAARPVAELADQLGLAALVDQPITNLSGGERQRAAILRALASDTPIVMLDEPTSQLDEANAETLAGVLRREARAGRVIVCATHDPVLIAHSDEQVTLDEPLITVDRAAAAANAPPGGGIDVPCGDERRAYRTGHADDHSRPL